VPSSWLASASTDAFAPVPRALHALPFQRATFRTPVDPAEYSVPPT
jgi:hypothetical protein